jgi:hypothetical protein
MNAKDLGARLQHWHNGMDSIYAAGSTLFAGHGVKPEVAQAAKELLERDLVHAKNRAHGWGPKEVKELSALIKALGEYAKKPARSSSAGFQKMLDAYVEAALFSSSDESDEGGGDPLDKNYGPSDLAADAKRKMAADVKKFLAENADDIGSDYKQAGHDFWLTRNGHGAGFWDGDWLEEAGERLTKASKRFGEQNLYVSRKKVHVG